MERGARVSEKNYKPQDIDFLNNKKHENPCSI